MPNRASGGIFDRLNAKGCRRRIAGHRSARLLKRALAAAHGTLFPRWIEYLQGDGRTKQLLRYHDSFVREVCPSGDAWERRPAEKFGVLMAAGQLAVKAGLLDWPHRWPMLIMRTTFARHKASSKTPAARAQALISQIARDCNKPNVFLRADLKGAALFGAATMGLHYRYRNEDVIALRDDMLVKLAGDVETRRAFDALLAEHQLARGGQGNRNIPKSSALVGLKTDFATSRASSCSVWKHSRAGEGPRSPGTLVTDQLYK